MTAASPPAIASPMFALPTLDADTLRDTFARNGCVRIEGFLDQGTAQTLRDELLAREDWKQVLNSGAKLYELTRSARADLPPERATALEAAIYADARDGFQFRYEAIRVPDLDEERALGGDALNRFARWMSDGEVRSFLRHVADCPQIDFADCQATAYWPGDFLTGHDDAVPGKNRHAAYVLSLNPIWRIEWGGLLLMHLAKGRIEGVAPAFATLDIFSVGQMHSVSEVSKAAPGPRLSVTGWLRSR